MKDFQTWLEVNKIVRYIPYFKRCWNAAMECAARRVRTYHPAANDISEEILKLKEP